MLPCYIQNEWKKIVRELLEKQELEFDMVPLILEMTNNVRKMERNDELILKPGFLEVAKKMFELLKPVMKKGSRVFIAYDVTTDSAGRIATHSDIEIPLDTILQLLE